MSKTDSLIFNKSRRIDDLSIYDRGGQMIIRPRHNRSHTVNRNLAQLRQKVLFRNTTNLWSSFPKGERPLFEEGCAYDQFRSYAMQAEAVYLTREEFGLRGCVVTHATVGAGTLPPIEAVLAEGVAVSSVALGSMRPTEATTVAALSRAVVESNADFRHGDRLLFYCCRQGRNEALGVPTVQGRRWTLPIDLTDEAPLGRRVGDTTGFGCHDGRLATIAGADGGVAWVHARPVAAGLLLSTQRLCVAGEPWARWQTEEAVARAAASFGGLTETPFVQPEAVPLPLIGGDNENGRRV